MLQGCTAKAKKLPKLSPETKADIEAFEGKLAAIAAEKREEQATAEAALRQAAGPEDMDTSDGEELTSLSTQLPPTPGPHPKAASAIIKQCSSTGSVASLFVKLVTASEVTLVGHY